MKNDIVVFEVRICPKPLMSAGAKSDTHLAFKPAEETKNPQWSVCLLKEGKPTVFQSKDHSSADPNNPWGDAWSNIYRDYCHYYGNSEIGYRRRKERIVKINGIMLDFDHHSNNDMPLEKIAEVLVSDEFAAEVPYSKIVMSGNGYQVHLPISITVDMEPEGRILAFKNFKTTVLSLMAYFRERWALNPDKGCTDPNRLHRLPNTWNTKAVANFNDYTNRKKATLVKAKEVTTGITHEFIKGIINKYNPGEIETKPRRQSDTADALEVKDALNHLNPANLSYDEWLKIGMALKSWHDEDGLELWDNWSQRDPDRYDSSGIDSKWGSFSAEGGVTLGTLFHMSGASGWKRHPRAHSPALPVVCLPGNGVKITTAGKELGNLLAGTKNIYRRGEVLLRLQDNDFGAMGLCEVSSHKLCSLFEYVADLCVVRKDDIASTIASAEQAEKILACPDFLTQIPRVTIVTNCPVLVERPNGDLEEITGYDADTGILSYGKPTKSVSLDEAVKMLKQVVCDFDFLTPNDQARAMASLISPALILGRLINSRAPIDTSEADETQAGKGYRNKLISAIYNEIPAVINFKKSGIGGLEESFDSALIRGKPFISLDNIRGKMESQKIESYMTEDNYQARMPYKSDTPIDPRRHIILMTSNKSELNKDMSERTVITRIRKRPDDYGFVEYAEGDIHAHIVSNQPKYLGAVYAVVRAWHQSGKPKAKVNMVNTYANWFCVMEWIVANIFGEESMVTGHKEAQQRTTSPLLGWLRDVCLAVKESGKLGKEIRTIELLDIIETKEVEIPFFKDGYDPTDEEEKRKVLQLIGRKLGPIFSDGSITVDGFLIEQIKHSDGRHDNVTYYKFTELKDAKTPCSPNSPNAAPIDALIKPLISPIAAIDSQLCRENFSDNSHTDNSSGQCLFPLGALGNIGESFGEAETPLASECMSNLFGEDDFLMENNLAESESSSSSFDWP